MGWWRIESVETGQVLYPTGDVIANVVPGQLLGQEVDDGLFNGDKPADDMGAVLRKISDRYQEAWGRPAKKEELTAVFNFCCNGMFR